MNQYIERLKQIRVEKKLSLDEVAERVGMSGQCLAMIELGEIVPTERQLEAITEFVIDEVA